ncbi:hypothetical protein [Streptomyces sp. NPDC002057]|uniref:hypothetical protein n=1 Tax=Streptomyces sp. NPDC002057 TaxID=3154664 RepID=UPI0033311677
MPEDIEIRTLKRIAAHVSEIWSCHPEPTHLLFQLDRDNEACALRAVRRVGSGYVRVERSFASQVAQDAWIFDDHLPWDELGVELEVLMADREGCAALAKESGGWWRLALCSQTPEAEIYQAYEAHTVIDGRDPGAEDAGRGYDLLQAYLTAVHEGRTPSVVLAEHVGHTVTLNRPNGVDRVELTDGDEPPSEGTAVDCIDCRTNLHDQWSQPGDALATGDAILNELDVIDAVTALLHHADGWHAAQTVLDRALHILIQEQQMALTLPDFYDKDADPRALDTISGAVAAYYSAAARFGLTGSLVAQQSLTRFRQETEAQRLASLRIMREGLTGQAP